jgi:beta-lactam-binding protein with PASTA domain
VKEGVTINLVLSTGKEEALVPNVLGRRLGQAKEILEKARLKVGRIDYVCDEDKLFDIILRQDPRPGIKVPKSTAVNLTINAEEEE